MTSACAKWPDSVVTEDERTLLLAAGFTQNHASAPYVDFERWPGGFGEDDDDRVERVTLVDEPGPGRVWFGSVIHHHKSGLEWYQAEQPSSPNIPRVVAAAIGWLYQDRKVAPKQPALVKAITPNPK